MKPSQRRDRKRNEKQIKRTIAGEMGDGIDRIATQIMMLKPMEQKGKWDQADKVKQSLNKRD